MTELVAGRPLKDKLPVADAIDAARQIARGLAAAHSAGVIHRDLKPDNILRTRDGRLKIVDFGLAKMREQTDALAEGGDTLTLHTQPGMAAGTAGYMSPEQVRGEEVDGRSDIFNIGLILYEMLSGERAFRATTSIEMLHAILKDAPPLAAQQSAGVRVETAARRRRRFAPPLVGRMMRTALFEK